MPGSRPTLLVAQSGGATAVINASLAGVISAAQVSGQYGRILGARYGIEGLLKESFVDLTGLNQARLDRLRDTPSSSLGTGRHKLRDDEVEACLDTLGRHDIDTLVLIGGNDSADTVLKLHRAAATSSHDLCAIAVPKTVDNDLMETDHCPGYGSMARAVATIVRDATWDTLAAPALYPVKFIEVMGRDAGWVTAAGCLAFDVNEMDLAPLLLLPEHPPASVAEVVSRVDQDVAERGWSVVVVPETLRSAGGDHFGGDTPEYVDPHGHPYFPSAGASLARAVSLETGLRARFEKPGSFTRMAASLVSVVDRNEAYELGRAAVDLALKGTSGVMPALIRQPGDNYSCTIEPAPVERIANHVKVLPAEFVAAGGTSMTAAFMGWAMPLLGPSPFPQYERPVVGKHYSAT